MGDTLARDGVPMDGSSFWVLSFSLLAVGGTETCCVFVEWESRLEPVPLLGSWLPSEEVVSSLLVVSVLVSL